MKQMKPFGIFFEIAIDDEDGFPRAYVRPVMRAEWCPKFLERSTRTTCGSCFWKARAWAKASSGEPSLTKMIS